MSKENVLKVENITMQFGGVVAVDNVSLEVHLHFCLAWRRDNETVPLQSFVRSCRSYGWPKMRTGADSGQNG